MAIQNVILINSENISMSNKRQCCDQLAFMKYIDLRAGCHLSAIPNVEEIRLMK